MEVMTQRVKNVKAIFGTIKFLFDNTKLNWYDL